MLSDDASVSLRDFACRLAFRCAAWDTAERWLMMLLRARPDDAAAWFNLAIARLRRDRYPEAIEAVRRSLILRPGHPGAEHLLADAERRLAPQEDG